MTNPRTYTPSWQFGGLRTKMRTGVLSVRAISVALAYNSPKIGEQ